jgi:predicted RNA-binding Zn-ribbon protein involved in translation (DUF1610 family)
MVRMDGGGGGSRSPRPRRRSSSGGRSGTYTFRGGTDASGGYDMPSYVPPPSAEARPAPPQDRSAIGDALDWLNRKTINADVNPECLNPTRGCQAVSLFDNDPEQMVDRGSYATGVTGLLRGAARTIARIGARALGIGGAKRTTREAAPERHDADILQADDPDVLRAPARQSSLAMTTASRHRCPVCGYPDLEEPPRSSVTGGASYEICPSCGFQFGVTDDDLCVSYEEWRRRWVERGMPWDSAGIRPQPQGWDPPRQLQSLQEG